MNRNPIRVKDRLIIPTDAIIDGMWGLLVYLHEEADGSEGDAECIDLVGSAIARLITLGRIMGGLAAALIGTNIAWVLRAMGYV